MLDDVVGGVYILLEVVVVVVVGGVYTLLDVVVIVWGGATELEDVVEDSGVGVGAGVAGGQ